MKILTPEEIQDAKHGALFLAALFAIGLLGLQAAARVSEWIKPPQPPSKS